VKKLRSDFSGEFPVGLLSLNCRGYQQQHEQCSEFFHCVFFCAFSWLKKVGL